MKPRLLPGSSYIPFIQALCDIYQVRRVKLNSQEFWNLVLMNKEATRAPDADGGCNVFHRIVYTSTNMRFKDELHELLHVVLQPPFTHIDDVPEDFVLMQVERAIANHLVEDPKARRAVLKWQDDTIADRFAARMTYFRTNPAWKRGYVIAQKLGVLDERHRPTFKNPTWENLDLEDVEPLLEKAAR